MRVIPVLDIAGGVAVHGHGGLRRESYAPVHSVLSPRAGDVARLAGAYRDALGLAEVYVADLDAIAGGAPSAITGLLSASGLRVWLDAGASSAARAQAALEAGARHVVVGLETLPSLRVLHEIVDAVGADIVAFSLDLRDGRPIVCAGSGLPETPEALASAAAAAGIRTMILLDLGRVGSARGVELETVHRLRTRLADRELIVGGGVRDVADLVRLAEAGVAGALVATALHDGRIGAAEVARVRELKAREHGREGRDAVS